ncbi:autotransporter assembly complex family protein [Sutterella sp.]|uniref:autotransporter assembly complex protein TamA n=1 Tax=Sutterella sp. TaxID=1981025 RepID=UPI0026E006D5|nr:autotransporter assembly complex family protein [Sutterella sp.]MDO5531142.1 autotransporter assembly complex family protein [Sutterella sp.]
MSHLLKRLAFTAVCGAALTCSAADFSYRLEGLEGALNDNVRAQLSSLGLDSISLESRYRAQIRTGIRTGLRALGYYAPKITFTWGPEPAEGSDTPRELSVKVDAGEPVLISGARLTLRGECADDEDFRKLLENLPHKGAVLHHGEYETFKKTVQSLALRKGYFHGQFVENDLAVAPSRREAWWRLTFDSGQRWNFGPLEFTGSQIDQDVLDPLIPFKEGEPYTSDKLAQLNENLADTGWFNSAVVAPDFHNGNAETRSLPLTGTLTPRTRNLVEVGIGYSTDVGPRFSSEWTKPWINSRGHSLTFETSISAKEQEVDFSYKIPVIENPLQEYWLLQGGFKNTNLNDTKSMQTTLMGARYWNLAEGWQRSVNLHWLYDNFEQGLTDTATMVIYPGISFSRTRSRGGAMPSWGDSQRYSFDIARKLWGSDIDFWAVNAQGAIIRSLAQKHRFIGRYAFGWIDSNNFDAVPPDLRFFAGGDRSVRGYDYKSISPKDSSGELRGAQRLLTASIEYQYNVTGAWWGAVFVDAGEAVDRFSSTNFKVGSGVGIRWQSPVGPVKFDIARPVGDSERHGFTFYIGLGPEL